jgi:hypothetical protein
MLTILLCHLWRRGQYWQDGRSPQHLSMHFNAIIKLGEQLSMGFQTSRWFGLGNLNGNGQEKVISQSCWVHLLV